MDQHLTFSETVAFTGKSKSTIRRLLHEIASNKLHPDRLFLLPSVEEVERRKAAKEPYVWKIDRQLLAKRFPKDDPISSASPGARDEVHSSEPTTVLYQLLQEQLKSKDQQLRTLEIQLDRKDEQISSLNLRLSESNERMRETNVLMRELQQRLALPFPKPVEPVESVETRTVTPQAPRTTAATKKPAPKPVTKPVPKPAPKRVGFFDRFFRHSK